MLARTLDLEAAATEPPLIFVQPVIVARQRISVTRNVEGQCPGVRDQVLQILPQLHVLKLGWWCVRLRSRISSIDGINSRSRCPIVHDPSPSPTDCTKLDLAAPSCRKASPLFSTRKSESTKNLGVKMRSGEGSLVIHQLNQWCSDVT